MHAHLAANPSACFPASRAGASSAYRVPQLSGLARFSFLCLCAALTAMVVWVNIDLGHLQAQSKGLPFGVFALPDGSVITQDFAYNRLFVQGISERIAAHPYRLADQETLVRHMVPEGRTGMTHAYSPVLFVLMQPLLAVSGSQAYLIYTILCALGILALFRFCLLPCTESPAQIYAL
jgi:hypothetical protein